MWKHPSKIRKPSVPFQKEKQVIRNISGRKLEWTPLASCWILSNQGKIPSPYSCCYVLRVCCCYTVASRLECKYYSIIVKTDMRLGTQERGLSSFPTLNWGSIRAAHISFLIRRRSPGRCICVRVSHTRFLWKSRQLSKHHATTPKGVQFMHLQNASRFFSMQLSHWRISDLLPAILSFFHTKCFPLRVIITSRWD